jgi:membrane protease YdiL (CAAX protease family)
LLEEILFRGIFQAYAIPALGTVGGVGLTAAIFAIMHAGWYSPADVVFAGLVGCFFSLAVQKTRSIAGVSISHGLANFTLFVLVPLLSH